MIRSIRFRPLQTPFLLRTRNFWWSSSNSIPPTKTDPIVIETIPLEVAPAIDTPTTSLIETTSQLSSVSHLGDFKLLALASGYSPVGWVEQFVELTHISLGLPWIGTIICSTAALRLLLVPMAVKAKRLTAKAALIKPEVKPLEATMARYRKSGDQAGQQETKIRIQKLLKKHQYNPTLLILSNLGHIPVFICSFLAFKHIGDLPVPGLSEGGIGWITDLSAADPYYILPTLTSIVYLSLFEVYLTHANTNLVKGLSRPMMNKSTPTMKVFARVAAIVSIPLMAHMPSALFVYLITHGICGLLQFLAFRTPRAQAYLKGKTITELSFKEKLREGSTSNYLKELTKVLRQQRK